jgi:hypothetical protein
MQIPDEMFKGILGKKGLPEKFHDEMLQNMQLMPQFGYYGGDSLKESHSVCTLLPTCHHLAPVVSQTDECLSFDRVNPCTPVFIHSAIELADIAS